MAKSEILVGIEIGSSQVCVAVGETARDGTLRILAVGEAQSAGIRKGEIVDFQSAEVCLREALADAENKAEVTIHTADCLGVTGAHIGSFNSRGVIAIPEDQDEITEEDCQAVQASAMEVSLPAQGVLLHELLQAYHVGGQSGVVDPVGMSGDRLEAEYHIIYGVAARVQNSMRCVSEVLDGPDDVAFNGYASAQVVLAPEQKQIGALILDMGGGTTDYVLYADGAVRASGVLAVGGDHITNDLSLGLRLPMTKAEKLKIEEGHASAATARPGDFVTLRDGTAFAERNIERHLMNSIIEMRVRETFDLVRARLEADRLLERIGAGVFLTGGCSLLKGIRGIAEDVFEAPVGTTRPDDISGITAAFENPRYSTAIGLVKYAQASKQVHAEPRLKKMIKALFGGLRVI